MLSAPLLQLRFWYPCPSSIYYIFPSSPPSSFVGQAGMRKKLQHQALHAKESLSSSEPSTIRAPVECSHWQYPAFTKPCSEHFQSPAWFQCFILFQCYYKDSCFFSCVAHREKESGSDASNSNLSLSL